MQHILLNNKKYKHINFNINSRSDLSFILKKINEMEIPGLKIEKDLFIHSIIELINNSICAHIEKNIAEPVKIRFSIENEDLHITIVDKGKGFNTKVLPFDLNAPVTAIDINGKNFQIYREKSNYKRFGTGIFTAKKTFDDFELYFFNHAGESVTNDSEEKEGTIVKLTLKNR
ncbi:MAG: ATP-binding protein [Spirochaetaceae bacterium]|nr:ATP-binding protein [Spirochaetaceae bacterium]